MNVVISPFFSYLETVTMTTEYRSSRSQPTTGPYNDGLNPGTCGNATDTVLSQENDGKLTIICLICLTLKQNQGPDFTEKY